MKKILFTGGSGKFGQVFKRFNSKRKNIFYPTSNIFDVTNIKKMEKFIKKIKPKFIIHTAAISRPMDIHEKKIEKSISTNIIGTSNLVNLCNKYKIKLIYFSTNYVYPSKNGNYNEHDALLPFNNYAWSKLGGECSVKLYKNSLILRVCMTEKPFIHKKAFANVKTSFMYHDEVAKILFKLLNKQGIINIGGRAQYIYNFAKKENKKVKKIYQNKKMRIKVPFDSTINIKKLQKIVKVKF